MRGDERPDGGVLLSVSLKPRDAGSVVPSPGPTCPGPTREKMDGGIFVICEAGRRSIFVRTTPMFMAAFRLCRVNCKSVVFPASGDVQYSQNLEEVLLDRIAPSNTPGMIDKMNVEGSGNCADRSAPTVVARKSDTS